MTKEPISAAEPALWAERLAVLKAGLDSGDPTTDAAIKAEIAKLAGEISGFSNRREFVLRADLKRGDLSPQAAKLTAEIEAKASRVDDLKKLLKGAKRIPTENLAGPTPEATAKPARVDPIEWLERNEREKPGQGLTHDMARAAKEIASVREAISRAGQAKVSQMGGGAGGGGFREPEMPPRLHDAYTMRYLPWADWLNDHDPVTLDICTKVAVYGASLNSLARKHKMRRASVLDRLQRGLHRYWDEKELLPIYLDKVERNRAAWLRRDAAS
jgi:hypothetical protein